MKKVEQVIRAWYEVGLECSNRDMYNNKEIMYNVVTELVTIKDHNEGVDGYFQEKFQDECDYEGDLENINFFYSDKNNEVDTKVLKEIFKRLDIEYNEDISGVIKFTIYSTPKR